MLSQVKFARDMGVSTTPLREAMRLLQAEGLLIAEHNRRARVAPLDPEDIDAVYGSRILVEALAIRLTVPGLTAKDLAQLRSDLEAMAEAGHAQDIRAWEPVHRAFHRRLISGCDAGVGARDRSGRRSKRALPAHQHVRRTVPHLGDRE